MSSYRKEISSQVRLAAPVVLAQLGTMLMGFVDTLMVGRIQGEERAAELALSAVTMGNVLFFVGGSFAFGTLNSLEPLVSQALGAEDRRGVALAVQRGVLLALGLSLFVALPLLFSEPLFRLAKQPPEAVPLAVGYVHALLPSTAFFFLFGVLRLTLQAMHSMRPILIAVAVANLANVLFNWALVFGNLGLPALGAVGSGWATTLSRTVLFGLLLALAWPELRPSLRPFDRRALAGGPLARILRLGVPVGFQSCLEFGAFALAAIVMGALGSLEQAAHAVAINVASLSFMVPLGISAAASVRVGRHVGRGDPESVRRSVVVAMGLGTGAMACSATAFVLVPELITSMYTDDAAVLGLAAVLLPLAGVFQLFDGIQVVALGCLRGVADTFVPMLINLFGYWAVGLPIGYWLTFELNIGATGPWWGLVAGLAAVALILLARLRIRLARNIERVDVEHGSSAGAG